MQVSWSHHKSQGVTRPLLSQGNDFQGGPPPVDVSPATLLFLGGLAGAN